MIKEELRLARFECSWNFKSKYVTDPGLSAYSLITIYGDSRHVPSGWFYYKDSEGYVCSPNIALLRLDARKYVGKYVRFLKAM